MDLETLKGVLDKAIGRSQVALFMTGAMANMGLYAALTAPVILTLPWAIAWTLAAFGGMAVSLKWNYFIATQFYDAGEVSGKYADRTITQEEIAKITELAKDFMVPHLNKETKLRVVDPETGEELPGLVVQFFDSETEEIVTQTIDGITQYGAKK